ncbi:hypothetical protein AAMO2058_000156100 [Amorphochlora amoebiformis]
MDETGSTVNVASREAHEDNCSDDPITISKIDPKSFKMMKTLLEESKRDAKFRQLFSQPDPNLSKYRIPRTLEDVERVLGSHQGLVKALNGKGALPFDGQVSNVFDSIAEITQAYKAVPALRDTVITFETRIEDFFKPLVRSSLKPDLTRARCRICFQKQKDEDRLVKCKSCYRFYHQCCTNPKLKFNATIWTCPFCNENLTYDFKIPMDPESNKMSEVLQGIHRTVKDLFKDHIQLSDEREDKLARKAMKLESRNKELECTIQSQKEDIEQLNEKLVIERDKNHTSIAEIAALQSELANRAGDLEEARSRMKILERELKRVEVLEMKVKYLEKLPKEGTNSTESFKSLEDFVDGERNSELTEREARDRVEYGKGEGDITQVESDGGMDLDLEGQVEAEGKLEELGQVGATRKRNKGEGKRKQPWKSRGSNVDRPNTKKRRKQILGNGLDQTSIIGLGVDFICFKRSRKQATRWHPEDYVEERIKRSEVMQQKKYPAERKKKKNQTRAPSPLNDDEEGDMFEVEKILDLRDSKNGPEYLVKWKGFTDADNTWESRENMCCPVMLKEFHRSRNIPLEK